MGKVEQQSPSLAFIKACFFNEFPPAKNKKKHKVGKKKNTDKIDFFFLVLFYLFIIIFPKGTENNFVLLY